MLHITKTLHLEDFVTSPNIGGPVEDAAFKLEFIYV